MNIINVITYLSYLGDTNPSNTWYKLKEEDEVFNICIYTDEFNNEYLSSNFSSYLKSKYEKLKSITKHKLVIDGIGFNSEKELEGYLKSMLKSISVGIVITGANRRFLAELLSRSSLIASDCKKYGTVVDIKVNTKAEFAGKFFEVQYANDRFQMISIMKYLNPSKVKLVDIEL